MTQHEQKLVQLRLEQHKNAIQTELLKELLEKSEAHQIELDKQVKEAELDVIVTEVLFPGLRTPQQNT